MRRAVSLLLTFLCIFSLAALTGCGDTNKPLTSNQIKHIVQERYGTTVFILSDNTGDDHRGSMWFGDKSGFKFRVECDYEVCEWDFLGGKTYDAYEYYIPAYYRAHPELFDIFSEDGHRFEIDEKGKHVLYFDSYSDLDEIAEFACNCVGEINITEKKLMGKAVRGLHDSAISLYFEPSYVNYEWEGFMQMSIPNHFYTPETLSEHLKEYYIRELMRKNDKERLAEIPDEDIEKYS